MRRRWRCLLLGVGYDCCHIDQNIAELNCNLVSSKDAGLRLVVLWLLRN